MSVSEKGGAAPEAAVLDDRMLDGLTGRPPGGAPDVAPSTVTRRAAVAAGLAGVLALAAQAAGLARPEAADAADGSYVRAGRTTTATRPTGLTTSNGSTAITGTSATGDGVAGVTNGPRKSGVYGVSGVDGGYGVFGRHLRTRATGSLGTTIDGVQGTVVEDDAAGVRGMTERTRASGVVGENHGNGAIGALGHPNGAVVGVAPPDSPNVFALSIEGPVRTRRSGSLVFPPGASSASNGAAHLRAGTNVFAMVQGDSGGVAVAGALANVVEGRVYVYLTAPARDETSVAYWLLEEWDLPEI